jgi:hypothetical protein
VNGEGESVGERGEMRREREEREGVGEREANFGRERMRVREVDYCKFNFGKHNQMKDSADFSQPLTHYRCVSMSSVILH